MGSKRVGLDWKRRRSRDGWKEGFVMNDHEDLLFLYRLSPLSRAVFLLYYYQIPPSSPLSQIGRV